MFISKAGTIQSTVVKTICTTGMKDDPAIGLMRTEGADLGVDVLAEYEVGLPIVPLKRGRFGGLVGVPLFFLPV